MLRFGIFDLNEFQTVPPGASALRRKAIHSRRVSLQLLRTGLPASPRELTVFETLMTGLRLSGGVYRTTYRERFRDLDAAVNRILAARYAADAPLVVHD